MYKRLMVPRDLEREEQWKRTKKSAEPSKEEGSGKDERASVPEAKELPKELRPRSSPEEGKPQASLDLCPGGV